MLFANAVFNVFTGLFDVTNCVLPVLNYVHQDIAVVFLTSHPILRSELCFLRQLFSSVLKHCVMRTTIFAWLRVFRALSRYGLARVINYAYFFPRKENLYLHSCKATRWQKADRGFHLPREHSNEVSVYRRAANEPNQGSSMHEGVQNASNSCSTRQNNDSARKNDNDSGRYTCCNGRNYTYWSV